MSVVNQMLRDLENQKQPAHQFDLRVVGTNSPYLTKVVLLLVFSTLIVGGYWWANRSTNLVSAHNQINEEKQDEPTQLSTETRLQAPEVASVTEQPTAFSQQVIKAKPDQAPTDTSKINNNTNINSPKAESFPQHAETKSSETPVAKESRTRPPEKAIVTSSGVKQETAASQLNRKLQQILATQNVVGNSQVIVQLQEFVKQNPRFEKAHLSLIKLGWEVKHKSLEESLLFAIQNNPEQPAFRVAAARFYLQQGNFSKAESIIHMENENAALSSNQLQVRALIYQKQNKHQLAINDYALLLNKTKNKAGVYLALAISLEALGEVDRAEQSYRSALRENQLNSRQIEFVRNKLIYLKG